MQAIINWLEVSLAPNMNKINNNIWVQTLKDSMMQILPMIFVGSLVTMLAILQDFFPAIPNLWTMVSYSFGIVGLFVAFLIPFNYMERRKLHHLRLVAGMAAAGMYLMSSYLHEPEKFAFESLGAGGIFVAIIVGIFSGTVVGLFGKFSFFKEDSSIPEFVRAWFDNMIPVTLCIGVAWFLIEILSLDIYSLINAALSPLTFFSESIVGFTLLYFLMCFLYTMGISTWMIYSLTGPIMLANITENAANIAAGLSPTKIMTSEVIYSGWIAIGGAGGTMLLCLMLVFLAKSRRLKAIGKASIFPSILNINEPIVFGTVVWNPILMIPMWIHGIVAPVITFLWLKGGLANIPSGVFAFWYFPFPASTWIVSRSLGGLVLVAILLAVNFLIYYPFFKLYDRQQVAAEAEKAAKKAAAN
ncbi:MAG: PTS transporter subunit EIIC [Treponema sp.]|nr:PTS transporter subunit EIIC [Treponema sp.]